MLKNRIIPCLDVKNGRVVKGINFLDLKDAGDPVEQASIYDKGGADEICFLDITASNENRNTIIDVVSKTAEKCFVPLTVGGGIRTTDNIRELLLAGADKVSINTAAVKDINFVKEASKKFGTQCMVVAVDAKKTSEGNGKYLPMVEEKILELMQLIFLNKLKKMELERFYLPQWIKMELKLDMI